MNAKQLLQDVTDTTARLSRYHAQIIDRLANTSEIDPACQERRQLALALKERLNRARIAMAAVPVQRRAMNPLAEVEPLDMERMTQDLDRTAERMNTLRLQIDAFLKGAGRTDPKAEQFRALAARQNTARVAVLAAREAARAYAPVDYRVDEILY
jgi:hypothetical protein